MDACQEALVNAAYELACSLSSLRCGPRGKASARELTTPAVAQAVTGLASDRRFLDRQLKGELGLDHNEGRSYAGFHHHCALVTCAHAFLTFERLCGELGGRPDAAASGAAPAAPPALLGRPLPNLSSRGRSR